MVGKLVVLSFVLFAADASIAAGGCTKGSEYEPVLCPIRLPKVRSVHIEENGAKATASQDQSVNCASFRINEKIVRRFLSRAKEANESDAHHTLDWSPCYASGTLVFYGGKKAHWSINQMRSGSLAVDGEAGMFLYCPTCNFKPFQ